MPSVARVWSAGTQDPVGLGFVLDHWHVITCAHVVNGALGREDDQDHELPGPGVTVRLEFPFEPAGPLRSASVAVWMPISRETFARRDIAVLKLGERLPETVTAGRLRSDQGGGQVCLYLPARGPLRDEPVDGFLQKGTGNGLWQVSGDPHAGLRFVAGASGGPVWYRGSDLVAGMVQSGPQDGHDPSDVNVLGAEWLQEASDHATGARPAEQPQDRRPDLPATSVPELAGPPAERFQVLVDAARWARHPPVTATSVGCGLAGFLLYQGAGTGLYDALRFLPFLPPVDPVGAAWAVVVGLAVAVSAQVAGVVLRLLFPGPRGGRRAPRS